MERESQDLLSSLLQDVSRSFYLTLRFLPVLVRPQISLAYLLARASDTIADTDAICPAERLVVLDAFRRAILQGTEPPRALRTMAGQQSSPAERSLLQRSDEAIRLLRQFDQADQELIRQVTDIIISGQTLDLERFAKADAPRVVALETDLELDNYTYRVAGCVGEFWTRMCRRHLFPQAPLDEDALLANSVRFGKGLQLVNILRDLPGDLRLGRCYLPRTRLAEQGLRPAQLLEPIHQTQLRPLYDRYLDLAEAHLAAGWSYTNTLPFGQVRVRLACAWPILIGIQTLGRLRDGDVLDPSRRIKITRKDVKVILIRSVALYPWRRKWRSLFECFKMVGRNTLRREPTLAK